MKDQTKFWLVAGSLITVFATVALYAIFCPVSGPYKRAHYVTHCHEVGGVIYDEKCVRVITIMVTE